MSRHHWLITWRVGSGGPCGSRHPAAPAEAGLDGPGGAGAGGQRALQRGGVAVVAGDEEPVAEVDRPAYAVGGGTAGRACGTSCRATSDLPAVASGVA